MIVTIAVHSGVPAVKPRPLLKRGIAFADEVILRNTQPTQCLAHCWPGALADPDRRDIGGFDDEHFDAGSALGIVFGCYRTRCQPARSASANNYNPFYRLAHAQSAISSLTQVL